MKGSIAIGSRRTTPTAPVAAAVVSEESVAPMKVPCVPVARLVDERDRRLAAAAEEDRVDRHAVGVVVLGREHRALLGRGAEAAVGVGRLRARLAVCGRPVVAVPVGEVGRRLVGHALPPHVAVVGEGDVGEDRVALVDRGDGVRVGRLAGAGGDAEEPELRVHGIEPTVLTEAHPGDVVADHLGLPAGDGRRDHREVRLATGGRERRRDVVDLPLWVGELEDEHVLGHPALVAGDAPRRCAGVALLAEQGVAAVAGAVAPDRALLGEVDDVLRVGARPGDVLLALGERRADGVQGRHEARRWSPRSCAAPSSPQRAMTSIETAT